MLLLSLYWGRGIVVPVRAEEMGRGAWVQGGRNEGEGVMMLWGWGDAEDRWEWHMCGVRCVGGEGVPVRTEWREYRVIRSGFVGSVCVDTSRKT